MSQRFGPTYLTKDQFIEVLEDLKTRVCSDDSFEGSLTYSFPWSTEIGDPADDPNGPGFRVQASYRVGNSQGQGGMRMVGEMVEVTGD